MKILTKTFENVYRFKNLIQSHSFSSSTYYQLVNSKHIQQTERPSSGSFHLEFDSFIITCLINIILFDVRCLAIPDLLSNWTTQSHLLFLQDANLIQSIIHHLSKKFYGNQLKLIRPNKYPAAVKFLKALDGRFISNVLNISLNEIPNNHQWSGRAVLVHGLPSKLSLDHVERSMINFGLPIQPVSSLDDRQRIKLGMYWPIWDPISSSSSFNKESTDSKQTKVITRHQVIYTSSSPIAAFVASELHRSRPSWLGSSLNINSNYQRRLDWELKARVIY
ncbi:hypothetical protein O181_060148 [Austropuccinia psidii MF-1]|uniref:Uncharacterized protein n=1 Tax=Austropuccinia psidii MF-1 TaxID=1389203 RepID=A0A9Q3HX92_9BASI|nr:hypothetical protein [Austropuccinia psidii MF-1]